MNKVTKGTLAAAAAGALLLGGAGTYATWSDNATLNAGNVDTGSLTMEATTEGWTYDDINVVTDPVIVTNPVIVPGDELTAVYKVSVDTTGDNIEADLQLVGGTAALPAGVEVEYVVTTAETEDLTSTLSPTGTAVTFADAADYDFTVEVVLTTSDTVEVAQLADINLAGAQLTLTQS
ncbi:alternate-type signal peptide domain-containing protein [Arthrobacter sp. D2-10]